MPRKPSLPKVFDGVSARLMGKLVVPEVVPFGIRLVTQVTGKPRLICVVKHHVFAEEPLTKEHVRTGGALPAEVGMALHQVLLDSHHAGFHHLNSRSLLNMAALF